MATENNTTEKATKSVKESKVKTVKIRLPRYKKDQEDLYVSVNGERFIVQRGVEVEVPAYVAEVIRNSEEMRERAFNHSK